MNLDERRVQDEILSEPGFTGVLDDFSKSMMSTNAQNICPRRLIGQDATLSRWSLRVRSPSGAPVRINIAVLEESQQCHLKISIAGKWHYARDEDTATPHKKLAKVFPNPGSADAFRRKHVQAGLWTKISSAR